MNLALTLQAAAERHPEREAVVEGDLRITYGELRLRASRLAGRLSEHGVGRGDHLVVLLRDRTETVLLYWACQWLGAWFVPLNFRMSAGEVDYCVRDAGACLLVYEEISAEAARRAGGRALLRIDVDADPEALDGGVEVPGAFDLPDESTSLMLYTSGTTGRPKGVPRSHRADRAAALAQVIHHGLTDGDRTLCTMPLYHTMAMHSLLSMPLVGGCLVMLRAWAPAAALELVARERVTSLYLAPTLFHDLLMDPACASTELGSVRSLGYAGAPMSAALARRCAQRFVPQRFFNHYGSTEVYIWSAQHDQAAKPGCAGRAAVNSRLRLVRPVPDARPDDVVAPGEEGQIISEMTSEEAFAGYWHRPEADSEAIRQGWYYSGDVGRLDDDGDLWVIGRMDDMINSGGENIHPVEVEDVLMGHPKVAEAAVIGAPDERLGARVVAFVVGDGVEDAELDRWCRESQELASFKRPREYHFVDSLPRSSSGKLLRRHLREGVEAR
jgi:2-furoate---CoA ligase